MTRAILLALVMTGGALAQAPAAKPPATIDPRAMAPTVSELEKVKVENLSLKISALETEIEIFVTQFEKAHPGWSVNVKTQQVYQKPTEQPAPPPKK